MTVATQVITLAGRRRWLAAAVEELEMYDGWT